MRTNSTSVPNILMTIPILLPVSVCLSNFAFSLIHTRMCIVIDRKVFSVCNNKMQHFIFLTVAIRNNGSIAWFVVDEYVWMHWAIEQSIDMWLTEMVNSTAKLKFIGRVNFGIFRKICRQMHFNVSGNVSRTFPLTPSHSKWRRGRQRRSATQSCKRGWTVNCDAREWEARNRQMKLNLNERRFSEISHVQFWYPK